MDEARAHTGLMSSLIGNSDDATLARAAQAGEMVGLGMLFERHRARLHAVAVGMLGYGPDAEDAVQDAIVIAMRRIGDLREPAAAGGWLATIVVNVCRARLRRPPHELPTADIVNARGALDSVQQSIDQGALSDWIWTALERLPEPQRLTVMLRHFSTANSYAVSPTFAVFQSAPCAVGSTQPAAGSPTSFSRPPILHTRSVTRYATGHSPLAARCVPSKAAANRSCSTRCSRRMSPTGWPTGSSVGAVPTSPPGWRTTLTMESPPTRDRSSLVSTSLSPSWS